MALKITCPHCGHPTRLTEPYPLPGASRQCPCGRALAITYPMGMVDFLRRKGSVFEDDSVAPAPSTGVDFRPTPPPRSEPTPPMAHRAGEPPEKRSPTLSPPREEGTVLEPRPIGSSERTEAVGGAAALPERPDPAFRTGVVPNPGVVRAPSAPAPAGQPIRTKKDKKKKKSGGWLGRIFASSATLGALLCLLGVIGGFTVMWYYGRDLPSVEALGAYRPPTVTTVYDANGELMGEIYEKRRYVVPLDRMPKHLLQSFIAAEDANFYTHGGIDYMGIVRAIGRNAMQGKKAQGASTITQQVARNFLLTNEKTFARKIKEVLLSRRIEQAFDKEHILFLYLNQIYLGSGAYGVEAAARVYFGKHVEDLDVAESAMIAGLPQRPSDYSPHRHFEKAKARQSYVLGQMVDNGFLTQAQSDAATKEQLTVVARRNEFLLKAPWFTEHVRRHLVEAFGQDRVYNDGIEVTTTCDLKLQQEAQKAVTEGVTGTDEKVGWRGAAETLGEASMATRIAELTTKNDEIIEGERYQAVVTDVQKKHAIVDLGGGKGIIPLAWTGWAYKPDPNRNSKYRKQDDLTHALTRGDVVTVEVVNRNFKDAADLANYADAGEGPFAAVELYQEPDIQGALYSYRLEDGAVLALVGGVDFKDTQFNRAIQAQRQVGSTFKPIVYAAAIESKKFTVGTIVQDAPIVFNTLKSQLWKPENYGEDYLGDITLRKALALSRNVVTIRVLDVIGLDPVYNLARKLGIESPMEVDLSMGLGSASLNMPELARAYSAFATLGRKVEPHYINKVVDRDGKVLEQWQKPAEWERVIDPGVAGIANWLLQEVASNGTAAKAQKLGLHVAGKTGTTNDFHDAWFVGFTPTVLTAVWVGYDQPKSLGSSSTGGYTALPIWMDYMEDAVPKADDRPFAAPPGVSWVSIDEETGRPMAGGRGMPFLPGTAPAGAAAAAGQKTSEDLLTTEW